MQHAVVRLSDLASHGTRGAATSLGAGRGIIIGKLSAGELPDEPWELIYSAVRHTVRSEQYKEFERGVNRVKSLFDLDLLVRTHLGFGDPMPPVSEATFKVWMTKWANHLVWERMEKIKELSIEVSDLAASINTNDEERKTDRAVDGAIDKDS